MGCGNSKNATLPLTQSNLGSEGSTATEDEYEHLPFIENRQWGTPAPPLPHIGNTNNIGIRNTNKPHRNMFLSPSPINNIGEMEKLEVEPVVRRSGGEAFVIQDENDTPTKLPPRRLKSLHKKPLTMDQLIKKQREIEQNREQKLLETKEKARIVNQRAFMEPNKQSKREFEKQQITYSKTMEKQKHAEKTRKDIIDNRRKKVKDHHEKVELRRKSILKDNANLNLSGKIENDSDYNKSESESWESESYCKVYDQMEYISNANNVHENCLSPDDGFFS